MPGLEELINLLGGLAQSGINAAMTAQQNKKNREWSEKMYDIATKNNREDATTAFNRSKEMLALSTETDYQTQLRGAREMPTAQLQGYKNAGVNLGLALQGGLGGVQGGGRTATSPQASAASPMPAQQNVPLFDITAAMKNIAETKLTEQKVKESEAETDKKGAETNAISESIKQTQENVKVLTKTVEELDSRIQLNKFNAAFVSFQTDLGNALKGITIRKANAEVNQIEAVGAKIWEEARSAKVEADNKPKLINALIDLQGAQTNLAIMNTIGQDWQNKKDAATFQSFVQQSIATAANLRKEGELTDAKTFNEKTFNARFNAEQKTKIAMFNADQKNQMKRFDKDMEQRKNEWRTDVVYKNMSIKQQQRNQEIKIAGDLIGAMMGAGIGKGPKGLMQK